MQILGMNNLAFTAIGDIFEAVVQNCGALQTKLGTQVRRHEIKAGVL